jgi:hypothetical protein
MNEWRAISARIQALVDAGRFFFDAIGPTPSRSATGPQATSQELLAKKAAETIFHIRRFANAYESQFPDGVKACMQLFLNDHRDQHGQNAMSLLIALDVFRAEFEHLIADAEPIVRSLTARAFTHLQRSIVADDTIRERWKRAFSDGETACEALGACHLLGHGIWAFKTSATGERTDLVLGEPLGITDDIRSASQGLVLTEWKLVRKLTELQEKTQEAFFQAKRYCQGILAGYELASIRYLVIVSEDCLDMPSARQESEAKYEYRNIAVNPRTPSAGARGKG